MTDSLPVLLGKRFLQRRDAKAIQHPNGAWTPVTVSRDNDTLVPWKLADLEAHVAGKATMGHYLVGLDDTCKLFAFDLDLTKEGSWISLKEDEIMGGFQPINPREAWLTKDHPANEWLGLQLRCMAEALAMKTVRLYDGDIQVAISYSGGKGLHVYGFFAEPVPASDARGTAREILNSFHCFEPTRGENFFKHTGGVYQNIDIEVFPKQDSLEGKKLGNLMALPLGIHAKTGRKKFFLDCRVGYNKYLKLDPMTALEGNMPPWGGTYEDAL